MSQLKSLWVDKYAPQDLSEYVWPNKETAINFLRYAEEGSVPNLLLTGIQGSGKTTLVNLLIRELGLGKDAVLTINASDDNSVDVIRERVTDFVSSMSLTSDFKIVFLDECDYITHNAQAALRTLMVDFSGEVRFILAANYRAKIMPALISRCQHYHFTNHDPKQLERYVKSILAAEQIEYTPDVLAQYITAHGADLRQVVQNIEQNSGSGKLLSITSTVSSGTIDDIRDYIVAQKLNSVIDALPSLTENDWDPFYRTLYETVDYLYSTEAQLDQAYITIAHYMYTHALVADREINARACIAQLSLAR